MSSCLFLVPVALKWWANVLPCTQRGAVAKPSDKSVPGAVYCAIERAS